MKKIILIIFAVLLLIAVVITTVLILKKDTPAPTLRNAKKIEKGMNYSEVIDILGEQHGKRGLGYQYWNVSDAPYNLFINFSNNQNPYEFIVSSLYLVKIISREDAQKIQVGMSLQEVEDLLGSKGMPAASIKEAYEWRIEDGGAVRVVLGEQRKVIFTEFYDEEGDLIKD